MAKKNKEKKPKTKADTTKGVNRDYKKNDKNDFTDDVGGKTDSTR